MCQTCKTCCSTCCLLMKNPPANDSGDKDKKGKKKSKGSRCCCCFTKQRCAYCFVVIFISVGVSLLLLAQVVLGAFYYKDCPRERYITMYLCSGGAMNFIISNYGSWEISMAYRCGGKKLLQQVLKGFFTVISLVWCAVGSYWIYHIYGDFQSTDPDAPDYCHGKFYKRIFWIHAANTAIYVLVLAYVWFCTYRRNQQDQGKGSYAPAKLDGFTMAMRRA